MRTRTRIEYVVTGEEVGLSSFEPYVTTDQASAEEADATLLMAKANGVHALVLSDLLVYGRDGWEHPYPISAGGQYHKDRDTVEKVVARCGRIMAHYMHRADIPAALQYCRDGRVNELGVWRVELVCTTPGFGGGQCVNLTGPSEEHVSTLMKAICTDRGYREREDGLFAVLDCRPFIMQDKLYRLIARCEQKPKVADRKAGTNQIDLFEAV